MRAVLGQDPAGGADPGAVDDHPQRPRTGRLAIAARTWSSSVTSASSSVTPSTGSAFSMDPARSRPNTCAPLPPAPWRWLLRGPRPLR